MATTTKTGLCAVCGRTLPVTELYPIHLLPSDALLMIQKDHATVTAEGMICRDDRARLRADYVGRMIEEERKEVTALDKEVIESLHENELLTENLNRVHDSSLTFGQRVADKVAEFGGSWAFIGTFGAIIFVWITINAIALLQKPFDPFPFILLNLILSCVAAMQAPVIMMSQNRQEARDRLRAEEDYKVNLKAEVEIRTISLKLDEMMLHQWQRLLELQQMQIELLEGLHGKKGG